MSLRRLKTVSRRGDWRETPTLFDRATFARYPQTDGRFTLILFADGDESCGGWRYPQACDDYGRFWGRRHEPIFAADSQDGTGYLQPLTGSQYLSCAITIPQSVMFRIPEGAWRASLTFSDLSGAVTEVLSELVTFIGSALAPPLPAHALTADLQMPVDAAGSVNSPIFIPPYGAPPPLAGADPAPPFTGNQ